MSKNNRPEWHEPAEAVVVVVEDPIEDTIEVGVVMLADGPLDPVPLGEGPREMDDYDAPRHSAGPMPNLTMDGIQDKGKDVTQQAQDAAQGVAAKAQDAAAKVQDKAQDIAQGAAGKVQDLTQKVAAGTSDAASTAKAKASDAAATAKAKAGDAAATTQGALSAFGNALWTIAQRSPLQTLSLLGSLVWLLTNNSAAAKLPPVSINDAADDAAEKVGTVAGHVQVAASNLGAQVQGGAQRGAGWFTTTLQQNPLVIGAIAIVVGAGLGLAVPETEYENHLLGETRDKLADQAQAAASDLTHKVQAVAQTAAQTAVDSVKDEAKNQGLTGDAGAAPAPQDSQAQSQS
jgi:hypothetical protein